MIVRGISVFFIYLIAILGLGFISEHYFSESAYYPDFFNNMLPPVRGAIIYAIIWVSIFLLIKAIKFLINNHRLKK